MTENKKRKLMFASDIHGDFECARLLFEVFKKEGAEKLFLLGDLLYHGPRNDLPAGYNPKATIALLNENKDNLLCVRGNCEAEVDGMVLSFPVMAEYAVIFEDGMSLYLTHGHHIGEANADALPKGSILVNGHTHIYDAKMLACGVYYLNPGSVSLPKNGQEKSYMVYSDGVFEIKSLINGEVLLSVSKEDIKKDGNNNG